MTNLLARQIPTKSEAVFIIVISFGIIGILGYSDIIVHDFYVKPTIAECFPDNQEQFCTDLRNLHGLPSDAQIDIGNKYWDVQKVQLITFLLLLFFIKIAIVFGKPGKNERIKFSGLILFTAMVWAFSGAVLFAFGGIDITYYGLRSELEMPDELPWLNDSGAMVYFKILGDNPEVVEKNDLIIGFLVGVGLVIGVWLILIYKTRKLNKIMRKRGI